MEIALLVFILSIAGFFGGGHLIRSRRWRRRLNTLAFTSHGQWTWVDYKGVTQVSESRPDEKGGAWEHEDEVARSSGLGLDFGDWFGDTGSE